MNEALAGMRGFCVLCTNNEQERNYETAYCCVFCHVTIAFLIRVPIIQYVNVHMLHKRCLTASEVICIQIMNSSTILNLPQSDHKKS